MQGRKQPDNTNPLPQLVHDLNQPLSAITNYAQAGVHLLDNNLADAARLKELFEKITVQCGRATVLSQKLGSAVAAAPSGKDPF